MDRPISAGDVGRYAFCPLNWKLSLKGHEGAGGKQGARAKTQLTEQVDALELYRRKAHATQDTALMLGLLAASGAAVAVEVFLLERGSPAWWVLLFLSVIWMAASLYLVVFNLYYKGQTKDLVRQTNLPPGDLVMSGAGKRAHVLQSRILPLRGAPDYVVHRDGVFLPVAVKTGKTPPAPFDSHVLQLASYCYLVEEEYGVRPPHGVVQYPGRQFEVAYTDELQDRLLKTLLRIELARRTGEVHRDHENPKRCMGCSRRQGCPERLDLGHS